MRLLIVATVGLVLGAAPVWAEGPSKIAFVDTGNTGRSLAAEAIGRQMAEQKHLDVLIISRGVDIDPFETEPEKNAATQLTKRGIDVQRHRAVQLTAQDVSHADLIVTMTAKHKTAVLAAYPAAGDRVVTIGEFTGHPGDVVDAYGKPMEAYEAMVQQVGELVPIVLEKAPPHRSN